MAAPAVSISRVRSHMMEYAEQRREPDPGLSVASHNGRQSDEVDEDKDELSPEDVGTAVGEAM